eukprot:gene22258-7701_t
MIAVALGMAGMTMSSANALSDPHASDRLPKSEASGTLGFSKIGAWTPMLDENNVEVLSNEQLESRNLVKLASGKLYPIVKDEDGFVSGLNVVWNSIETSDDGNKIVVDWFESYGGPATMLWSDTYNMYIQPQYEGNWVDGNNPFGQFVHYYMAFEPTEELKVYTLVGAKSDTLKTEWTIQMEVPEANGESLDRDDVVAQLFNDNAIGCAEAKGGNQCAVPFIEFVCTTTCGGTYEAADFERDQDSLTVGQFGMRCPCGATVESCKSAAIALACPESCAAAIAGEELDQQEQDACEDDVRKAKEAAAKAAADALANADNNGFDRNDIIGKLFNDAAVGCAAVKANGQCANPFLTYICSTTCEGEATEDDFKKDSPLTLAQYGMTCCKGATSDSCVDATIAFVCPQ